MALHPRSILYILGLILISESLFFCVPLVVSLVQQDGQYLAYLTTMIATASVGLLLWLPNRTERRLKRRDIFLVVVLGWILVSLFGAVPYVLTGTVQTYTDAFFETVSGFTTTGATVLTDIEAQTQSILLWRSLTQWIGGMGIVVLMIAIIPLLGVGGMQLFNAESPGVMIDRLRPRVKETALIMWIVYSSLTVLAFLLLLVGGLGIFDAVAHAFTTMASGGFSTRQTSIGAFSPFVQYVVILFMFLTATNYALLYAGLTGRLRSFWQNDEFKAYITVLVVSSFLAALYLFLQGSTLADAVRHGTFQVVSIATATGFVSTDYTQWAPPLIFLLVALMFVGGMSGSTTGSIKIVRYVLLIKGTLLEFRKHIHRDAILPLRFNNISIPEATLYRVSAFFVMFILIFVVSVFILLLSGLDMQTAVGAAAATLGNIGPGIGDVGPSQTYAHLHGGVKYFLSSLMIVGRLELFTVLILLTPYFWRRY